MRTLIIFLFILLPVQAENYMVGYYMFHRGERPAEEELPERYVYKKEETGYSYWQPYKYWLPKSREIKALRKRVEDSALLAELKIIEDFARKVEEAQKRAEETIRRSWEEREMIGSFSGKFKNIKKTAEFRINPLILPHGQVDTMAVYGHLGKMLETDADLARIVSDYRKGDREKGKEEKEGLDFSKAFSFDDEIIE